MPNRPKQYAVWSFDSLPATDQSVPVEFTFDIFRMMTEEVGKGIYCTFASLMAGLICVRSSTHVRRPRPSLEWSREWCAEPGTVPGGGLKSGKWSRVTSEVAFKHGIHEAPGKEITDYHTQSLICPPASSST